MLILGSIWGIIDARDGTSMQGKYPSCCTIDPYPHFCFCLYFFPLRKLTLSTGILFIIIKIFIVEIL